MAGRPAKTENPALTKQIEKFRLDRHLSYTQLAKMLDVHCTTLTRSVTTNLYSKDLVARTAELFGRTVDDDEALHLLRKFAKMLPQISDALRSVLDKDTVGD